MMKLLSKIKSLFQKAEGDFGKGKAKIKPGMNGSKKDTGKAVFEKTGRVKGGGQSSTYVPDEVKIGPEGRRPVKKRSNVVDPQPEKEIKSAKPKNIKKRVNAIKSVKVDLSGKRSPVKKTTSKPGFKKKTPKG